MPTGIVVGRTNRRGPHSRDDVELFFEAIEPFAKLGKGDAIRFVLGSEPPGAESKIDPSARHLIDLGDADGEWSWEAKCGR